MRALLAYSCVAPRRYAAKLPLHGPRCGGATAPGGQPINNQCAICNCDYRNGSGTCTDVGSIAPVGTATLGAGPWAQLDLTGELWEWSLDWYSVYAIPCTDCADTTQHMPGRSEDPSTPSLGPERYATTKSDPKKDVASLRSWCAETPDRDAPKWAIAMPEMRSEGG
jgi:formylglycine-generating enzyme required for sulfatase activity